MCVFNVLLCICVFNVLMFFLLYIVSLCLSFFIVLPFLGEINFLLAIFLDITARKNSLKFTNFKLFAIKSLYQDSGRITPNPTCPILLCNKLCNKSTTKLNKNNLKLTFLIQILVINHLFYFILFYFSLFFTCISTPYEQL